MERKISFKMMVTAAIFFVCHLNVSAQEKTLKILLLTPSPVEIAGRSCQEGDFFAPTDSIHWSSPNQILKALDISSGKIKTLTTALMNQADKSTFLSYVTDTRRLSIRGQQEFEEQRSKSKVFFSLSAERQQFVTADSTTITLLPAIEFCDFVAPYIDLPVADLIELLTDYLTIRYPDVNIKETDLYEFIKEVRK
ncbi:MAG: hypothetical protein LBR66_00445 [Candidatus Symbiothrix sp.]|jgi:hypothetical protein|nr:hypothetical protein [Candidatus Symbiothrix sp.]